MHTLHTHQVHELQALQQFTVPVLEPMSLVDDDTAPLQLPQLGAVGHDHLKGGDEPVELQDARRGVPLATGGQKGHAVVTHSSASSLSSRATYLSFSVEHLVLQNHLPADLGSVVHDDVHVRPRAELPLPVGDGGQGGDDEEGASDAHAEDLEEERDGLDGFPQTHLICQDAVFPERRNQSCY